MIQWDIKFSLVGGKMGLKTAYIHLTNPDKMLH